MSLHKSVLIIIPSLTLGGAEKQALEYAKAFKRLGHSPLVLGLGKEGEMVAQLEKFGIKHVSYSFTPFFVSSKLQQLFFLFKFIFFIRSLKCEVGISFTYWPNVIFKLISKYSGIKTMYWNQRSVDDKLQPIFWERLSRKIKVNYLANSIASAESIAKRHTVSQKDIQVIYNVMDLSTSEIIKHKKNTTDLIMVANFFEEKDHFTLIKAFQKLISQHTSIDLKLHLVGTAPGGSTRMLDVKGLAFDLGLCGKVVFHRIVSDVKSMLLQMDIGILSTYSEGFSNAIMEYMDIGLPVVASAIGPNIEALTDENREFLFEVENIDELSDKLERLILDKDLRSEVGFRNRLIAQKSFHVRNLDLKLQQLFVD